MKYQEALEMKIFLKKPEFRGKYLKFIIESMCNTNFVFKNCTLTKHVLHVLSLSLSLSLSLRMLMYLNFVKHFPVGNKNRVLA